MGMMPPDATVFTASIDATVPSGQSLKLYGWDGNNNDLYGTFVKQANGRYTVTVDNSYATLFMFKMVTQLRIYSQPYTGGTSVVTEVSNCALVVGTDAEYIPSAATIVVLPITLRSLPDGTKDELHLSYLRPSTREGWAWYSRELVKRVGKLVVDGSETWYKGNTSACSMSLIRLNTATRESCYPISSLMNARKSGANRTLTYGSSVSTRSNCFSAFRTMRWA